MTEKETTTITEDPTINLNRKSNINPLLKEKKRKKTNKQLKRREKEEEEDPEKVKNDKTSLLNIFIINSLLYEIFQYSILFLIYSVI